MSYLRVIPRDLFNEAKLLKCLGNLVIQLETCDGHRVVVHHDGSPFEVEQEPSDGSIFAGRILFEVGDRRAHFSTPLNSKEPWPLYCQIDDEVVAVFTDHGTLTEEFEALIKEETNETHDR
jgi:hypothetical protein